MGWIAERRKAKLIKSLGPVVSSGTITLQPAGEIGPAGEILDILSEGGKIDRDAHLSTIWNLNIYFSSTSQLSPREEAGRPVELRDHANAIYYQFQRRTKEEMGDLEKISASYQIRERRGVKSIVIRGQRTTLGTQVVEAIFYRR